MRWSGLKLRLRALLFRGRTESDLDDELKFHLAMEARKNQEAGMDVADARRSAAIQFGGLAQVKEECRDVRGLRFLETLIQDTRYALRGFRRTPGFALTVVATIGLGLGLNTTLFSFFNAYVLRPLAVRDPHQLYRFTWINRSGAGHRFTWEEYRDFAAQNPALSEVVGVDRQAFARVDGHLMLGHLVTGNYFQVLGVDALMGRTLWPEDAESPGGAPVVMLSYTAWTNKFGGDPKIVGRKLFIHGYPVEVVGVARAGFRGVSEVPLDYWAPLTLAPRLEEGDDLFGARHPARIDIIGRLRPELPLRKAESALTMWAQHRTAQLPDAERAVKALLQSKATVLPLQPEIVAAFSPIILGFGLVLAIACANVANMTLARAMARQREIGTRLAMGAGRARLIRQILTESIVLALPAAAAGFWISQESIRWGERLMVSTLPRGYLEFVTLAPIQPDLRLFAFMLVAAVVAALLFGLVPALQATRPNVMQAARGEFTTDIRAGRLRDALVIVQVAVSVLLLICAAVLMRANHRIQALDPGMRTSGNVVFRIQERSRAKALQLLAAEPGVQIVAASSKIPFFGSLPRLRVVPEHDTESHFAGYLYASPDYFKIVQVPILRGRAFTRDEAAAGAAVAVISRATARLLWPGQDALGKILAIDQNLRRPASLADPVAGRPAFTTVRVIGIARDAINGWVADGLDATCIYFPATSEMAGAAVLTRVNGPAETVGRMLDAMLGASIPGAVNEVHTMDEILAAQVYPFRALQWISSGLGVLALILTLTGLYGVLSYVVAQRTKEIGIRVALGAKPGAVARLVLSQSMRFALIGAVLGAAAAFATIRVAASLMELPMFGSFDGAAFAMGLALVIAAAAIAAWMPSRRAASIEPVTTLRCD
jgi:predicted permease